MEKQIKVEFLFGRIAELEKMEIDEDDYQDFVDYIVSSGGSEMTTEEEVYKYYGNGSKEDGKKQIRQLYRVNTCITNIAEEANVKVEKKTSTESTEK